MSLIKNNIKIEKNPFDLLEKWYKKAKKNEISNPNAMALSTVGPFNKPRTRMVLMKEIKENGIIFYTNSNSRKGNHINDNKNVSIKQSQKLKSKSNLKNKFDDIDKKYKG